MSADLTDWLAEVHAADERAAHEADFYRPGGHWEQHDFGNGYAVGAHIARHDPQSVLARIEAERQVCRLHRNDGRGDCVTCFDRDTSCAPPGVAVDEAVPWPCPTLRALAWGYRHRDGWRSEWAPEGVAADA